MINLGQVVAAMAGGAMLAIAIVLVFQLRSWQRRDAQKPKTEQETGRDQRIEAAARFADEYFDEFYDELTSDDDGDKPRRLPYGTKVVRSKGHLHLIGASVAAIASITTVARDALREHRGLASATIGGLAAASAVTTLTLTPWTSENHAGPPQPSAPSATSWSTPTPPPGNPTPSRPAAPAPSAPATAPPPSASPSPSPSSTSISVTSPSPTPPALTPTAHTPTGPGQGRGPQRSTPPGHDHQDQNRGNGRPGDGDEEDGVRSEQPQNTGRPAAYATLCGNAGVGPLVDVGVCVRGSR